MRTPERSAKCSSTWDESCANASPVATGGPARMGALVGLEVGFVRRLRVSVPRDSGVRSVSRRDAGTQRAEGNQREGLRHWVNWVGDSRSTQSILCKTLRSAAQFLSLVRVALPRRQDRHGARPRRRWSLETWPLKHCDGPVDKFTILAHRWARPRGRPKSLSTRRGQGCVLPDDSLGCQIQKYCEIR